MRFYTQLTFNKKANFVIPLCVLSFCRPQLIYIDMLENSITNAGFYTINPENYRVRENPDLLNLEFGFIQINLTNPEQYSGLKLSP